MFACNYPEDEMARPKITLKWGGRCAPVPDVVFVDVTEAQQVVSAPAAAQCQPRVLRVDPWTQPAPLDECLACWKGWMHGDADRDLGAKPMGGLVGDADGHGVDMYEQQQARDTRIAIATDAMIESMQRLHIWAIYKLCSLATPWNFPNADLLSVGEEARQVLVEKLKKNVCTSVLF
jgi:hypothetical protein